MIPSPTVATFGTTGGLCDDSDDILYGGSSLGPRGHVALVGFHYRGHEVGNLSKQLEKQTLLLQ